jgi:APA family basic amino acid/polyamine antiporter
MSTANSSQQLPRVLGPVIATAVVVGTVIGSGVFKKPFAVSQQLDEFGLAIAAWILVGLLDMMGALSLAEVATVLPRAGGNYVFLREGYGRIAGFMWGWVEFWMIRSGSIAALAAVFSESIHDAIRQARDLPTGTRVFGFWEECALTVAVIAALTLVNIRGVRWGGLLQLIVTAVKVSTLIGVILLPFVVLGFTAEPQFPPRLSNLNPVWPTGFEFGKLSRFAAAMVGVYWAYHGWMNIAPIAEEIKDPQRNIPRALIIGVLILIALYVGANVAYYLVIPQHEMKELTSTPVATEFSLRLLGPVGGIVTAIAIAISVFGAANGNILVGPRLLYAMAEDGLAPRALSRLHPKFRTPAIATFVLSGWSALLVLIVGAVYQFGAFGDPANPKTKPPFDITTDFAMFGAIGLETLAVLSVFVLRLKRPEVPRVYKCVGYPVVPALYGMVMFAVWVNMFVSQQTEAWTGIAFMAAGAALYLLFLRRAGSVSDRSS